MLKAMFSPNSMDDNTHELSERSLQRHVGTAAAVKEKNAQSQGN